MPENSDIPKSPEEILARKKEELTKEIDLMLDFKKSDALKGIISDFGDLNENEVDYIRECLRLSDCKVQLRGPLSETAEQEIKNIEGNLEKMKDNVRPELVSKLEEL
jgi:ABC-type phosphate transport system auxiliary subunit